jgi:hypothetical protein
VNTLDVKGNDEHALDYALYQSRLLRSRWVWTFRVLLVTVSYGLIHARCPL